MNEMEKLKVVDAIRAGKLLDLVKENPIALELFPLLTWVGSHGSGNENFIVWYFLQGYDMNKSSPSGCTCLHGAAANCNRHIMKILLSCGANAKITSSRGRSPLEIALMWRSDNIKTLLENGVRLKTAPIEYTTVYVTTELREFEDGVLRCRDVIVILLALKKRRHVLLLKLDRFLIQQELAVAIWATRSRNNKIWQQK